MYPSLESFCLKMSLAASLMAFSGVTKVRFTAAPGRDKHADVSDTHQIPLRYTNRTNPTQQLTALTAEQMLLF